VLANHGAFYIFTSSSHKIILIFTCTTDSSGLQSLKAFEISANPAEKQ